MFLTHFNKVKKGEATLPDFIFLKVNLSPFTCTSMLQEQYKADNGDKWSTHWLLPCEMGDA